MTRLNMLCNNSEISKRERNHILDLENYFIQKFQNKDKWAYYEREESLISLNMSLERYHLELKKDFQQMVLLGQIK